jgi:regulator of replication initiation timing
MDTTEKTISQVPQSVQDFNDYFNSVKSAIPASLAAELSNKVGAIASEYTDLKNATDGDLVEEVKQLRVTNKRLEDQVGTLDEGQHEDEREPRAATWLEERANHLSETKTLKEYITEIEASNAELLKKNDALFSQVNSFSQKNTVLEGQLLKLSRRTTE